MPPRRTRSPSPTCMGTIVSSLVLLLIMGTPACSVTKGAKGRKHATPAAQPAGAGYPGFGYRTTGGAGRPVIT